MMMLPLADIRDYIATLGIAEPNNVYMGRLENKKNHSIGIYDSRREGNLIIPIGGMANKKHDSRRVSFLIHWDKSYRNTEAAAHQLSEALMSIQNTEVNGNRILFIIATNPIPVDTDEDGVYEMVIDADFYYKTT